MKSDLPFGSEFSPSQVNLPDLLEMAKTYGGDWKKFENAVRKAYFEEHYTTDYNKGKLANNTKLGMIAYGIIDREANLTEFGNELYELRQDESRLFSTLGRHILLNLNGISLVQCVQDIQASGHEVNLVLLREWLGNRGIHFPRGGKHPSMMRLWLEKAGVFTNGWRLDENRYQELVGKSFQEIDAIADFSNEQRIYLRTLANIVEPGPFPSNVIEKLATATYGIRYNEKNLPKQVLYPLQEAGYISLERGTQQPGRGAKPFLVSITEKFDRAIVVPVLDQIEKQTGPELRALLRKSFTEILEEVKSQETYIRGLALEALAFKLLHLIDLNYVATRLRGTATGGAEVDLIFDTDRLVYSRWQIQCKNTTRVSLDDVAKEVGLTHFLNSNAIVIVIVIVSTGQISNEARRYANKIMQDSNLCIVMVDREDIESVGQNPTTIINILNREAKHAMILKKLEM